MRLTEKDKIKELSTFQKHNVLMTDTDYKELKLGQKEDDDEELGIDVITLFKALRDGFYYIKDNAIKYCRWCVMVGFCLVEISPCYAVKETTLKSTYYDDAVEPFIKVEDAHYWSWKTSVYVRLNQHGKTWALTKEELKNEINFIK